MALDRDPFGKGRAQTIIGLLGFIAEDVAYMRCSSVGLGGRNVRWHPLAPGPVNWMACSC